MKRIRLYAPWTLSILLLMTAAYYLFDSIRQGPVNYREDMVYRWDDRLQSLREALPSGLDQVGYVDTSMVIGDPKTFDGEEFFLMQYSVAPVALEIGTEQQWIIGNFKKDLPYQPWLDSQIRKYEIQYFGFDLYLIHKLDS